jgi:hypothetical protein
MTPAVYADTGTYRSDCSRQHPDVAAEFDLIERRQVHTLTLNPER